MERISESVDEVGRFGEVFQKLTSGSDEMNEPINCTDSSADPRGL